VACKGIYIEIKLWLYQDGDCGRLLEVNTSRKWRGQRFQ